MKRFVFLALLSASLCAAENNDYVGIGIGNSRLTVDNSSKKVTDDGASGTFILGHKYSDYGRLYASGTYVNSSDTFNNSSLFSLAYDFIFPIVENTFSLYAGPTVGYTMFKEESIDLSGFHYGAEAGAIVEISKKIELETGIRYLKERGSYGSYDLNSLQTLYFQVNIYFNGDKYFNISL